MVRVVVASQTVVCSSSTRLAAGHTRLEYAPDDTHPNTGCVLLWAADPAARSWLTQRATSSVLYTQRPGAPLVPTAPPTSSSCTFHVLPLTKVQSAFEQSCRLVYCSQSADTLVDSSADAGVPATPPLARSAPAELPLESGAGLPATPVLVAPLSEHEWRAS